MGGSEDILKWDWEWKNSVNTTKKEEREREIGREERFNTNVQ
jgi:hypothetical protein